MTVLLTTNRIGDVNRSRVLQAFVDHGALTRADVARLAGVPRATIGTIVTGLMDSGLLEELEPDRDGRVGKPGRPLWFAPGAGLSVAVGFTDSAVRAALVNARGERQAESSHGCDTGAAGSDELYAAVEQVVRAVLPANGDALGIGIAVPGVCDTGSGQVVASGPLPGAEGTHLVQGLEKAFSLPVIVDNDARALALGEKWFGDGRGLPAFAALQTGTGLGIGLVLEDHVFRGPDGRVGELGHTRVVAGGERCRCGLTGCWETVATLRWLRAEAARRGLPSPEATTTASLVALGEQGSALLGEYVDNLAVGMATLVNLLGIRRFFLHGDVVAGGEPVRRQLEHAVREAALGYLRDEVHVTVSGLDGALLGAAGLVLSETFRLVV